MTETNTWPGKPGVPLNPGVPDAHWLKGYTEDAWMYDGDGGWWGPGYPHKLDAETVAARYSYLGPCLTPDEATALQARVAKLETALQFIKDAPDEERKPNWNNMGSYEAGLRYCAAFANAALEGKKDE